jgi:hypothetical protein
MLKLSAHHLRTPDFVYQDAFVQHEVHGGRGITNEDFLTLHARLDGSLAPEQECTSVVLGLE